MQNDNPKNHHIERKKIGYKDGTPVRNVGKREFCKLSTASFTRLVFSMQSFKNLAITSRARPKDGNDFTQMWPIRLNMCKWIATIDFQLLCLANLIRR